MQQLRESSSKNLNENSKTTNASSTTMNDAPVKVESLNI